MSERLTAVIADDEPPARRKLRALLAAWPDVEIVGEAGDGLEAVSLLESRRPALAFLDIRMPELDGFDVLGALEPADWPEVVFVTAYDEFAVRAFEIGALDYVLKPVTADRLAVAVDRALGRLRAGETGRADLRSAVAAAASAEPLTRFVVRSLDRLRVVEADTVDWIEAAGNYIRLHTDSGAHLVRGTLQAVEGRLDPARFARIHRSAIVALDRVAHFVPAGHGDYTAVLRSGGRLTLSRRFRGRLPPMLFRS